MRAHEFIKEDNQYDPPEYFGYKEKIADKLHQLEQLPRDTTLEKYTDSLASEINDLLHRAFRDNNISKGDRDFLLKKVEKLDAALKAKKIKKDLILYTGIPHSPSRAWAEYKQDPTKPIRVHLPAYTSTTTDFGVARDFARYDKFDSTIHPVINGDHSIKNTIVFGGHVLEIHVPRGLPGGSVKDISYHKEEDEFVLPRGLIVEIDPMPVRYENANCYIWQARVVGYRPVQVKENDSRLYTLAE